jgi:hypothetical protein
MLRQHIRDSNVVRYEQRSAGILRAVGHELASFSYCPALGLTVHVRVDSSHPVGTVTSIYSHLFRTGICLTDPLSIIGASVLTVSTGSRVIADTYRNLIMEYIAPTPSSPFCNIYVVLFCCWKIR